MKRKDISMQKKYIFTLTSESFLLCQESYWQLKNFIAFKNNLASGFYQLLANFIAYYQYYDVR